jgi:hypothetical protein
MFVDEACRIFYVYFPHGGLAYQTRLASCRAGPEGKEWDRPSWTGLDWTARLSCYFYYYFNHDTVHLFHSFHYSQNPYQNVHVLNQGTALSDS